MTAIVAIAGRKGGAGKTTLSHAIGRGMYLLAQHCVVGLTDEGRELLSHENRGYVTFDCRSEAQILKLINLLNQMPDYLAVIDGTGNRSILDEALERTADLMIIPFGPSEEDMRVTIQDAEKFQRAWLLPTRYPTNKWERASVDNTMENLMGAYKERIMRPFPDIAAHRLLLQKEIKGAFPSHLNNACRTLARQIKELLKSQELSTASVDNLVGRPLSIITKG